MSGLSDLGLLALELIDLLHLQHKQSISVQRDFCMATISETSTPAEEPITKMRSLGVHSIPYPKKLSHDI